MSYREGGILTHRMTNSYLEHPTEEALERFLLHKSQDEELEVLETHILACDSCVTRLETLESELKTMKEALAVFETERIQKDLSPARASWRSWFTLPKLSMAGGAVAALAVGVALIPQTVPQSFDLSSARGSETVAVPEGKPLDLHLDTTDIPAGTVDVQVADANGNPVWSSQAVVGSEKAEIKIPKISQAGTYFLRFYTVADTSQHELLREFRFEVK